MPKRTPKPSAAPPPASPESTGRAKAEYRPKTPSPRSPRVSEPTTLNLYEAKTHLSDLVERAARGEEIVIAKAGTPMARLVPIAEPERPVLRKPGMWKGKIWVANDFDDPLPPEIQMYFDDPPIFPEEIQAARRKEQEILRASGRATEAP